MRDTLNPAISSLLKRDAGPSGRDGVEWKPMFLKKVDGPRQVTLPDGRVITRMDLPPVDTARWVASRKALVVQAVVFGLIGEAEACSRYALSEEEFAGWRAAVERHGAQALKVTATQKYRQL